MMETTHQVTHRVFQSEIHPEIYTTVANLAPVIAWADQHPQVYKIVTKKRSKAFGLGSCEYIGWAQRGLSPEATLERLRHFHALAAGARSRNAENIFAWRARFTLAHYLEKGFTGGFLQQHDQRYPRCCLTMDYTPETLEEVIDRFCGWMDRYFETSHITLEHRVVRQFGISMPVSTEGGCHG